MGRQAAVVLYVLALVVVVVVVVVDVGFFAQHFWERLVVISQRQRFHAGTS
jgi:hypothetical protein